MPWPLIAAMAGMEAGKGLIGYLTRPKVPKVGQTAAGKMLQKRAAEGIYDPASRQRIVNAAGRTSGAVAQVERSRIRGGLVRSGMGDSVAGARLMARPGLRRSEIMADTGEKLETENELSKKQGEEGLAVLTDQLDEQRRGIKSQGLQALYSGLLNAAGTAGTGLLKERQFSAYAEKYPDAAPLTEAYQAGVPVSPYSQRYFMKNGRGGSGNSNPQLSPKEIMFIQAHPDLFKQ